jgi:sugar lactone lactonase YvrE
VKNSLAFFQLCCLAAILWPLCQPARGDILVGTQFASSVLRIDDSTGASLPGGVASGSAGLSMTSGVTVGPDGNIYVSSLGTGEVLFFDGDTGQPLPSPHAGGRPGLFAMLATESTPQSTPGPLRFGPDGHLYVSDFGGNQVRKFNRESGQELAAAATVFVGPPAGLDFAPNGDLYVGDFGSASVIRMSGGVPSIFIPPQTGGLQTPGSLLFLPEGELLVADLYGDQVLKYAADGAFIEQFAQIDIDLGDDPPANADPSDYPSDIAYDAEGNLLVAVLGPTRPSSSPHPPTPTFGTLLRFGLEGGAPLETILDEQTPLASVAWIASADSLPGDYNGDGNVGPADHDKWRAQFGKRVARGGGADGNGDGLVDAADYVFWRAAAMQPQTPPPATALPEPSTAVIAILSAAGAIGIRRRSDQR